MDDLLYRRFTKLKHGDIVMVSGTISPDEMVLLSQVGSRLGVTIIASGMPEVTLELLDDITLARYGLRRIGQPNTPDDSPMAS